MQGENKARKKTARTVDVQAKRTTKTQKPRRLKQDFAQMNAMPESCCSYREGRRWRTQPDTKKKQMKAKVDSSISSAAMLPRQTGRTVISSSAELIEIASTNRRSKHHAGRKHMHRAHHSKIWQQKLTWFLNPILTIWMSMIPRIECQQECHEEEEKLVQKNTASYSI